ncbi:MAG: hypothetical protein EXR75_01200 [Myxococcales bacterium]|nr:hypothetical protein [Myxococcales bacterium]
MKSLPISSLPLFLVCGALATVSIYACQSGETTAPTSSTVSVVSSTAAGGAGGEATATSSGKGGAGGDSFSISTGVGGGTGGSCADVVVEAKITIKPADIIFLIDNSGSMTEEINGVEQNINGSFAQIIGASGVDYRVIMVTDHGSTSTLEVCIEAPLSTIPIGGCAGIGSMPPGENPGKFYHYSLNVQSWDSVCLGLDSLYGTKKDQFNLHPEGWAKWLRPEAVKVFVEVTDDRIQCDWTGAGKTWIFNDGNNNYLTAKQTALDIDSALLAHSPLHFGSKAKRHYIWYSLVGLQSKDLAKASDTMLPIDPAASALDAFGPFDPVTTDKCLPGAVNSGIAYQWLSKGTGGLRFPLCNAAGYSAIFNDIAAGVVEGAAVPCEIAFPEPQNNQQLDLNSLLVLYTPGDMSMTQTFGLAKSEAECGLANDKFYLDEAAKLIKLCPLACKIVEADTKAKLQVKIQCGGIAD